MAAWVHREWTTTPMCTKSMGNTRYSQGAALTGGILATNTSGTLCTHTLWTAVLWAAAGRLRGGYHQPVSRPMSARKAAGSRLEYLAFLTR